MPATSGTMQRVLDVLAVVVWVLGGLGFLYVLVRPAPPESPPYWRRQWVVVVSLIGLLVVVAADLAN
jgi:uncharacterized membrane protein